MMSISDASWRYLAELNSNQIGTYSGIENALSEIKLASSMPLSESYSVFACIIENIVVRYKSTDQAGKNYQTSI